MKLSACTMINHMVNIIDSNHGTWGIRIQWYVWRKIWQYALHPCLQLCITSFTCHRWKVCKPLRFNSFILVNIIIFNNFYDKLILILLLSFQLSHGKSLCGHNCIRHRQVEARWKDWRNETKNLPYHQRRKYSLLFQSISRCCRKEYRSSVYS